MNKNAAVLMEDDVPESNRWEAIKQYRVGYGAVVVLTMVFIYLVMLPDDQNPGYIFGYLWGGTALLLFLPGLFAWLGKTDTPKRRFVLFLALSIIIVGLMVIGVLVQ